MLASVSQRWHLTCNHPYRAAVTAAIAHGWLTEHPSGGYLTFTQAGADLFA
jgi:hypothetical protein